MRIFVASTTGGVDERNHPKTASALEQLARSARMSASRRRSRDRSRRRFADRREQLLLDANLLIIHQIELALHPFLYLFTAQKNADNIYS
jgi:hypothetical protein